MRIQNNIQAFNAYRSLNKNQGMLGRSLEKLSSGFRINKAADDAAGLVTSENLRSKISGLQVASRNTQDAISVVQTAEGSLDEVGNILRRMRDLAVQGANSGGQSGSAGEAAQAEIDQLTEELDRIFDSSKYGDKALFNSGSDTGFNFQVGSEAGDTLSFTIQASDVGSSNLGVSGMVVTNAAGASAAIASIDAAIDQVSGLRGDLGAFQNRLESTSRNLGVQTENLQAAESRIRDTDMALETVNFTKAQILQQAGVAMMAQANASPQAVLSLLG